MKKPLTREQKIQILYVAVTLSVVVMLIRAFDLTVLKGEEYLHAATNKVLKQIPIPAPRGEIRDKNGVLLAGNRPSFAIEIEENQISKSEQFNQVVLDLMKILKQNQESVIDEFPIIYEQGVYGYTFDQKIRKWKADNAIDPQADAASSLEHYARGLQEEGLLEVRAGEDQKNLLLKINEKGYYPPIVVQENPDHPDQFSCEFSEQFKKVKWLQGWGQGRWKMDADTAAVDAFAKLRKNFSIDPSLDANHAREILVVRDLIHTQGYRRYEPLIIAQDVKQQTVSLVEESSVSLPGVSVQIIPVRYYPNASLASHIIGQIGRIATAGEIEKYTAEKGYLASDMIGKTGIEKSFEEQLKGKNGARKVEVDVKGRIINDLQYIPPESGKTIYLSIDANLQKSAEQALQKNITAIQKGEIYESRWGNVSLRTNKKIYAKASSGAVVGLDIETGKVLFMASNPAYDPNIFSSGPVEEKTKLLFPENLGDSLAPKPLYNVATMTTIQPGSIFKMITGLAALEKGLDPNYTIKDEGFIQLDKRSNRKPPGCWIWNDYGRTHGYENMVNALRDSCNYYFYCISVGYDYSRKMPLPFEIEPEDILKTAKKFGLDEKTGIEIEEISGKVPDPSLKMKETKAALYADIYKKMATYFMDTDVQNPLYETRLQEIVKWADENPSRSEIIQRLGSLKVKKEHIHEVADLIKHSYFNRGKWNRGDIFNLAIGQGFHAYTPLQMANYIGAIANGGHLNKVSVVDKVESFDKKTVQSIQPASSKIEINSPEHLNILRQGMTNVTDEGSAKDIFENFPVAVAAKTGTAQKSGKIPPKDEKEYLLAHLSDFGVRKDEVEQKMEQLKAQSPTPIPLARLMKRAILELNPTLREEDIHEFKDGYDNFAWFVSYAPADKPKIAVVSLIFQGGSGKFAGPVTREVIAEYFHLNQPALGEPAPGS